jgi:endogenous inhibitor of DNA gyrase (YacG/DUF329 family)
MSPARVRCPTCRRETAWDGAFRPFCSERCRLIDLGAWLSEQRSIPGDSTEPQRGDAQERPEPGREP